MYVSTTAMSVFCVEAKGVTFCRNYVGSERDLIHELIVQRRGILLECTL